MTIDAPEPAPPAAVPPAAIPPAAIPPDAVPPAAVPASRAVLPALPRGRGGALLVAGGLGALGVLLFEVYPALGPFWAAAAGFAVLWPVRETRAGRAVTLAIGLVLAGYVLSLVGSVLAPFVVVFVIAFLLDPLVDKAEARGVPRWVTTLAVTLAVVGVVVGALVWLVPEVAGQAETLVTGGVALAQRLPALVQQSPFLDRLEAAGVIDRDRLLGQLSALAPQQAQAVATRIPALVAMLTKQVGALLGVVTTAALLPVLLFYMLKDYARLRDGLVSLLPRVDGRRAYLGEVGRVFGSYLRGQVTISAASAVLVGVPLFLFGVPFSLLLGLAAGVLNLVPSIGSILTYVLGVVLMLAFGTTNDLLIVLGVLAAQAVIEQAILTPSIMGHQVDLHPVVILIALFVSGALFGLVGLLLAVPGAALIAAAVRAHREAFVLDVRADDGAAAV